MSNFSVPSTLRFIKDYLSAANEKLDHGAFLPLSINKNTQSIEYRAYPFQMDFIPDHQRKSFSDQLQITSNFNSSIFYPAISAWNKTPQKQFSIQNKNHILENYLVTVTSENDDRWSNCLQDDTFPTEAIALNGQAGKFKVLPLPFLTSAVGWVVYNCSSSFDYTAFIHGMKEPILLDFITKIHSFTTAHPIDQISSEDELIQKFTTYIAASVFANQFKIGQSDWKNLYQYEGKSHDVKIELTSTLNIFLKLPMLNFSINGDGIDEWNQLHGFSYREVFFKNFVKKEFNDLLKHWEATQLKDLFPTKMENYITDLNQFQEQFDYIKMIGQRQNSIMEMLGNASLKSYVKKEESHPFQFFKKMGRWDVIWEGKLIEYDGTPKSGFQYIHKLLRTPDQVVNGFEMIGSIVQNDIKENYDYDEKPLDDKYSIRISKFEFSNLKEVELAIRSQYLSKPESINFASDEKRVIAFLRYYKIQLSLVEEAQKFETNSHFAEAEKEYNEEIKAYLFELEDIAGQEIASYHRKILIDQKIILSNQTLSTPRKDAREKVTKAIHYSIKHIKTPSFRNYLLNKNIFEFSFNSIYKKENDNIVDFWLLESDR